MFRTAILALAALGVTGVLAYNFVNLPSAAGGGSDPVDGAYSATRVELPDGDPTYASMTVQGQLTYDQLYGLHLKPKAQQKAFATVKQMFNSHNDLNLAAFEALRKDFPKVKWENRLTAKQEKVANAYYYIAYVLEANGADTFIRIDVDPIKPAIPGGCEGAINLLKPGAWTDQDEVKRPTSGEPNVALREKYSVPVYDMKLFLGTLSGKVKIPENAHDAHASERGKQVNTPKGGMVLTHDVQLEVVDVLYDGWVEAYSQDDIWTDPVMTAAEIVAPSCDWARKTFYTPDMFAVWEDLRRLNELASHLAFQDPRVEVAGMQGG